MNYTGFHPSVEPLSVPENSVTHSDQKEKIPKECYLKICSLGARWQRNKFLFFESSRCPMKISDTRSPVKTFSVSSILTNISMVLCMETNDYFQSFGTTKTRIISRIFIYINHRRSSCRRGFKGAAALPDKEGNQKVMNEELSTVYSTHDAWRPSYFISM